MNKLIGKKVNRGEAVLFRIDGIKKTKFHFRIMVTVITRNKELLMMADYHITIGQLGIFFREK